MERKVSGSRAVGLTLAAFLSLQAHAGGGGATGHATEITQLANNAELMAQVGEAVQTTANTLQTAYATMQMLRQLPANLISQMTGVPIESVKKMADAYVVMSQSYKVYQDAADVLMKAKQDAEMLNITPSELLRYKADAAYKYGGVYRQIYEQEQAKLARLAEVSKNVQKHAEAVKDIDANVKGIQHLASQNVQMQATMVSISESIAKANAIAALEAAKANEAKGRKNKIDADARDQYAENLNKSSKYHEVSCPG